MLIRDPIDFGAAVRNRRKALHLSQNDVANVVGVNRRVIGELERGKGSVQLAIAVKVAQAIGLDVTLNDRGR